MSTEQTQRSFTDTSPAPGPAGGRANPGLLFYLLPLSSAALGGLTVGGFFFVIAAAAFLSDRAGYGAALSVYGTVITLLPVSIVWAVLRWDPGETGSGFRRHDRDCDVMGQALGWRDLVDGSHGHRLDRHSGLGGGPSGPHVAG